MPNANAHSVAIATPRMREPMIDDGILNVAKPMGWTSHDVVVKLRRALKGQKVGHAGTLDPAATGVLPVLVGRGTRIAEYLMQWEKEYHAILRLGETTDTQDATGTVLTKCAVEGLSEPHIRDVVAQFTGPLSQVPPMYSAVKVGGVPLYKAARSGRIVERNPRPIIIHSMLVTGIAGRDVSLCVVCSKGTYVRTLCADIGDALGVGGHLLALERRRVGPLDVTRALTIERLLERLSTGRLAEDLLSLDEALRHLPELIVDEVAALRLIHGVAVPLESVRWDRSSSFDERTAGNPVRLKDDSGRLLAIGRMPAWSHTEASVVKPELSTEHSISMTKVLVNA